MNTDVFLENLRALTGLSDPMIGYLVDHADDFSDEQRKEIIAELKPLNAQSSKLLNAITSMYEKAGKKLSKFLRKDIPAMRKKMEQEMHKQEMSEIDTSLFS